MTVDTENYHVDNVLTYDVVQCIWNVGTIVEKGENVRKTSSAKNMQCLFTFGHFTIVSSIN